MKDLARATDMVASFMRLLTSTGGLNFRFQITAGAEAADPDLLEQREIYVVCAGSDAPLLLERDGELLLALEHIAAKILRLENEENDRISFDTDGFKHRRAENLRSAAQRAVACVQDTQQPYRFEPMSSRERRMLHLLLHNSGPKTASSGEGPKRCVVLYPEGYRIPPELPADRGTRLRSSAVPAGERSGRHLVGSDKSTKR